MRRYVFFNPRFCKSWDCPNIQKCRSSTKVDHCGLVCMTKSFKGVVWPHTKYRPLFLLPQLFKNAPKMHQCRVCRAGQVRTSKRACGHAGVRRGRETGGRACLRADGRMGSFCAAHTLRDHSMTFLLEKQFLFRRPQSKLDDVICFLYSPMHNGSLSYLI